MIEGMHLMPQKPIKNQAPCKVFFWGPENCITEEIPLTLANEYMYYIVSDDDAFVFDI